MINITNIFRFPAQFPFNNNGNFPSLPFPSLTPPRFPLIQPVPFPNLTPPPLNNRFPSLQPIFVNPNELFPNFLQVPSGSSPFVPVTPRPNRNKNNKKKQNRPKPIQNSIPTSEKLQEDPKLKMDIKLIRAIQNPESKFKVEQFRIDSNHELSKITQTSGKRISNSKSNKKSQKLQTVNVDYDENNGIEDDESEGGAVDAISTTGADVPIHAIFPGDDPNGPEEATLILEPMTKAIAGNDGKAISAPISHAILRRGTAVKLLYRPQVVAISGVGGISHAGSDLIVDFVD